jgi:hypothetical protein
MAARYTSRAHQPRPAALDAVKEEVQRKAGIGYHEVVMERHTTPGELKRLVEKLVPGVGG